MTLRTGDQAGGLSVESLPEWQLARRQRILDAAHRVLMEQEYEQIQIRDVAEAAKVARATLYRYFPSKEYLYTCVLYAWSRLGQEEPRFPAHYTATERSRDYVHRVIGAIERHPHFFKAVVVLLNTTDPNARGLMTSISERSVARLTHLFEPLGPDRAEDTATMLWSIVNTLTIRALYQGGEMSEVYRIADRFIDSIASDLR